LSGLGNPDPSDGLDFTKPYNASKSIEGVTRLADADEEILMLDYSVSIPNNSQGSQWSLYSASHGGTTVIQGAHTLFASGGVTWRKKKEMRPVIYLDWFSGYQWNISYWR
jgi:hypothetical protein